MSSSDRIMPAASVSSQRVRVGDPSHASPVVFDSRPRSVQEVEARFARQTAALKVQHQTALEQTYQSGFNDGAAMARAETDRERASQLGVIGSLTTELSRTRNEWFAAYEPQMVELIGLALEQILGGRPVAAEPVAHALRRAVAQLGDSDHATIRCHPEDLAFVREALDSESDDLVGSLRVETVADPAVQPGGCLVETNLGIVDARVEQQLRILRGVLSEIANAPNSSESA